jgi:uncharacterized membrane protein YgcG
VTRRLRLPILFAIAALAPASSSARELHWNAIDVRARLNAQGALHVVETQRMVFTGDWNGGERTFRVFPGQSVSLESMARIDPDGTRHALEPGGLAAVDEYGWAGENVLRWRSRLPSDPEFSNAELVYEIAYSLSGILVKQGSTYLLDHNFGLPDADWPIRKLQVTLELDPVWKPQGPFPGRYASGVLPPRSNFTVTVPLTYTGNGAPAVSASLMTPGLRRGMLGGLAAVFVLLYLGWRRRETVLGRFAPLTPVAAIDPPWLEKNLLSLSPEEAGALWDESIGAPEVAAVLARLSSEKKLATEASGKKLTMRLLVPVAELQGYDRDLVQALFFSGRKETDTEAIKAHYKSSGFDPASKIKSGLEARLKTHPDFQDKAPPQGGSLTAVLFLAGLAAHGAAVLSDREDLGAAIGAAITYLVIFGIGALCAWRFQKRVDRLDAWSPLVLWVPALLLYFAWLGVREGGRSPAIVVIGTMLLRLAVVSGVFFIAKTRNGPHRIARRKALASARRFFAAELDTPAPRLKDEWFPYVVAFGLTSEADTWFKAHGAAAAAGASTWRGSSSGSASSSSSSSPGGGWTGGGGAFGGAGASGTWAVAAGALAAGVSAPSSSSGGGGGGGGGSSGGGGGGGW